MAVNFKLLILERLYAQEDAIREQSSAIDSKGNSLLAIQTFLVGVLTYSFKTRVDFVGGFFLGIAALLMTLSGTQTFLLLKNRPYLVDGARKLRAWYENTMSFYSENYPKELEDSPEEVEGVILDSLIQEATKRVETNQKLNNEKTDNYEAAFFASLFALAALALSLIVPLIV